MELSMGRSTILCVAAFATISAAISSAAGAQQQSSELRSRPTSEETATDTEPGAAYAVSSAPRQHAVPPSKPRHKVGTSSNIAAVAPKTSGVRESELRKELRDKVN